MIAVLNKVFRILEAFVTLGDPVSLAELTEASGLPKPTVYRLVQSLVELGYLMQDTRSGAYLRTPAIERLSRNSHDNFLRQRLRPMVDKLHAQFGETTAVAVLCDRSIAYLLVRESSHPLRRVIHAGDTQPFHDCALGHAIAAFLPPHEQSELLGKSRARGQRRESGPPVKAGLSDLLEKIRQRGWASDDQTCDLGVVTLAVPILEGSRAIAALGLMVPTVRSTAARQKAMVEALLHSRTA